jgi:hypothetical protein
MIETAAHAWTTDHGQPIVAAVIAALRTAKIILPPAAVIERAAKLPAGHGPATDACSSA